MHDGDVEGGESPPGDADAIAQHHEQRFSHYDEAARLAMVAHPLPGEDLDTPYLEDAQMWLGVYNELLEFKENLLRDTGHALDSLAAPGHDEVARTDAVILVAEAQRFRQRRLLWQRRCEELANKS